MRGLALRTGWPTLYDITDDWLLAPMAPRQRQRLEDNERSLIEHSQAVVVCSPDLARTRGQTRSVELIPNGVDLDLFGAVRPRPPDLPPAPVALYVGTLHTWRTDVELLLDLARARPDVQVALVGPNSLPHEVTEQLENVANIHVLGARPYDQIPAYMQHADIIVIPHLVNPFTESLDPIKAYECLAVGRPTVTTPVAGFRELGAPIVVADRSTFVSAASSALAQADPPGGPTPAGRRDHSDLARPGPGHGIGDGQGPKRGRFAVSPGARSKCRRSGPAVAGRPSATRVQLPPPRTPYPQLRGYRYQKERNH